jgi:hypothetical protein
MGNEESRAYLQHPVLAAPGIPILPVTKSKSTTSSEIPKSNSPRKPKQHIMQQVI